MTSPFGGPTYYQSDRNLLHCAVGLVGSVVRLFTGELDLPPLVPVVVLHVYFRLFRLNMAEIAAK